MTKQVFHLARVLFLSVLCDALCHRYLFLSLNEYLLPGLISVLILGGCAGQSEPAFAMTRPLFSFGSPMSKATIICAIRLIFELLPGPSEMIR